MNESKIFRIDIEKIIHDKAGDKAKHVPRFIVSWLKRIIHQDEINAFLEKEGDKQGVPWLKDCVEGTGTYAQYLYEKNYKNEDMDKYFNDYYPSLNVDADLSDYLLSGAQAQKRVDEYNARIEDEEKGKLTVAEYAKFQDRVQKQYSGNVRASYSMTIEEFISRQIEVPIKRSMLTTVRGSFLMQNPITRNIIDDDAPTAASAPTPIHLPKMAASMMRYIC